MESPENLSAGITLTKVRRGFFLNDDPKDVFAITWEPKIPCTLFYGTSPGSRILSNYPNKFNARGSGKLPMNPAKEGISTGIYYCMLVSDNDPNLTSVEFKLLVQADVAPSTQAPRGMVNVDDGPPLFRWDPVSGVPYYFLFLSEGPLSIDRNAEGKVVGLTGLNLTWQIITPNTAMKFAEPDPSGTFVNAFTPPLFENIEYNWLVLNAYGPTSELISGEVAPVAPAFFEVTRTDLSQAPELLQPAKDAKVTDDEIVFTWNAVPNVTRYRLYLYEGREFQSSDIDFSVWSQITTGTEIRLKARGFLVRGRYHWRVVAENGGAIASDEWRRFDYEGPAGWAKFFVTSKEGPLSRVEFKVRNEANEKNLLPFLTDSTGFAKQALPSGDYTFTASRTGFKTTPVQSFKVPNNDTVFINIQIDRSPNTISGRIVDESGNAIFNATVLIQSGSLVDKTRSDDAGYFKFAVVPNNWNLFAYKAGFAASETRTLSLQDSAAAVIEPVVLRKATNVVSGEVTFARDSQPLQNALIRAEKGKIVFETTTNSQGGYQFTLGPGSWKIMLDPQGFFASPPEFNLRLSQNQQVSVPFLLFSGSLVTGKITFRDKGLSGATVEAFQKDTGQRVQVATSDVQGHYALGLRDPGEYELVASGQNFLAVRKSITIAQGQTLVQDFALTEAGFVKGSVINVESFEAVANAKIFVLQDTTRFTHSDANGIYVLSLPPDTEFQIDAAFPGFGSNGPLSVTTTSGDTLFNQNFLLQPLSGIIQGRVTDGVMPIPDAIVEILELDVQQLTDENGEFKFEIAPGSYTISASKECHFSKTVPVELQAGEAKQLAIELQALKSIITGFVRDVRGDAIEGSDIRALGDTVFTATSEVSGYYELCLNGGIFSVVASHLGFKDADTTLVISDGDSLGSINFILQDDFALVSGVVSDSAGAPVSGAMVSLTNPDQTLQDTSAADGSYRITKIYPGIARIQATKSGFFGKSATHFFQGNEQVTLNLTLFPADGFIRGTVRDSQDNSGIPAVTVKAEFSENPGAFFATSTDQSGNYSLTDLPVVPNATYKVFAFKDGFVTPAPISNVAPNTDGVDFLLVNKNGIIAGTVLDRDTDEPIENAKLDAINQSGSRSIAISDSAGRFLLSSLVPSDLYDVTASKTGYFAETVQNRAPGDTNLVIKLLRRFAFVTGQVTDTTGVPLENIKIQATPDGPTGRTSSVRTDASGSYLLKLIADSYIIRPIEFNYRSVPGLVQLQLVQDSTFTGIDFVLEAQTIQSISIQRVDNSVQPSISNLLEHCYKATARDVQNRPVNIGNPQWSVNVPSSAATIDTLGCLHLNPDFFGALTISATDPISGVSGALSVEVFATIDSTTETVLFDSRGLELGVGKNSVLGRKEMLLIKQPLAPAKKGRAEILTSDSSYVLKPAGLTFNGTIANNSGEIVVNSPIKLMLPKPPNAQGQQTFIAKWDAEKSQWVLFFSRDMGNDRLETNIFETGEYTSLAISKPLRIENIALYPNPFSPFQEIDGHPGLKIDFDLSSSAAPNPLFSIKIYNLEGNLVRLLHDQTPFPRGHSTVYWDGKTDNGSLARNGRYLVRLIVEDPADKRDEMKSVVLIK
ncbi:MAG: carboxypeptidase regulatory-like domain-containing protein [bacterium]